ncbi:MAG: aminomethyl-transferring glycine dehydrogenase subunit GcvPA [Spirochaetaceae bacterium]|nr:aminomethyl-transferring glycine dehydrogenase subunit GcvPA [Spirochaetaceae bacterium]
MSYVVSTKEEQAQMLKDIGVKNTEELFNDVPKSVLLKTPLNIKEGVSEFEVLKDMEKIASKNRLFKSTFRGAGSYKHLIPEVVKHLSSISGFLTSYTPYQAEISQGNLQGMFEFQSEICNLFDMDVSNSSVYDGASAVAEAMLMTLTNKKNKILFSKSINPNVQAVIKTYAFARNVELIEVLSKDGCLDIEDLTLKMSEEVSAVIIQSPNYYGLLEDIEEIVNISHELGIMVVESVNPLIAPLVKSPGSLGVDIVCGEAQPLGLDRAFGGPYVGFMATKKVNMRKLPGRIVGQTVDEEGKRAYVLTLQAREQHIRREKASSSICTNQANSALRCVIYMGAMGKQGLKEVATQCMSKSHYACNEICRIEGYSLKYSGEFFDEFTIHTPYDIDEINNRLRKLNIEGPLRLSKCSMLVCVTEATSREEIDEFISILKEVSRWS